MVKIQAIQELKGHLKLIYYFINFLKYVFFSQEINHSILYDR